MKVYVVFERVIIGCSNTEESVLIAIFSKEEYAEQYCDEYNTVKQRYWYYEIDVDEALEEIYD